MYRNISLFCQKLIPGFLEKVMKLSVANGFMFQISLMSPYEFIGGMLLKVCLSVCLSANHMCHLAGNFWSILVFIFCIHIAWVKYFQMAWPDDLHPVITEPCPKALCCTNTSCLTMLLQIPSLSTLKDLQQWNISTIYFLHILSIYYILYNLASVKPSWQTIHNSVLAGIILWCLAYHWISTVNRGYGLL